MKKLFYKAFQLVVHHPPLPFSMLYFKIQNYLVINAPNSMVYLDCLLLFSMLYSNFPINNSIPIAHLDLLL